MVNRAPVIYVESDLPDGCTLSEWRRRRHEPRTPRFARLRAAAHLRSA